MKHVDSEVNPPTYTSQNGSHWVVDAERFRAAHPNVPDATVAIHVLWVPGAHPFWAYYALACVHLRPTQGLPLAKLTVEGATHEVLLAALDPEREPDLSVPFRTSLRPLNFVGQFKARTRPNPVDQDKAAAALVHEACDAILAGTLNPDTDGRSGWVKHFQ